MKKIAEFLQLIGILVALALVLSLFGCNPVKKVLNDKKKLDKVAEVVVRSGYCANDTTFIVTTDTIVTNDTIIDTKVDIYSSNDTVYIKEIKYRDIVKNTLIRDTIKSFVVDMAQIKLLKGDISNLNGRLADAERKANKYLGWLIFLILCIGFALYLRYKK